MDNLAAVLRYGTPGIDAQHQQLVRLLGQLFEATQVGTENKQLLAVRAELQRYTVYHFEHEPELMVRFAIHGGDIALILDGPVMQSMMQDHPSAAVA